MVDSAGECNFRRWQSDWVAISYAHKQFAIMIIDLCRPSDKDEDHLEVLAATVKLDGYDITLYPNNRWENKTHHQCNRGGRTCQGNKL